MVWTGQRSRHFHNREGLAPYDFTLHRKRERSGVSAMVRVRNEEAKIHHCLRSILPVFDEIVVIDNASDDRTASIVEDVRDSYDVGGRIRLLSYPHRLARFGPEHARTPEDSLHSAVYYTNWALSQCSSRYVCKWDGDMVLVRTIRHQFIDFLRRIQTGRRRCWVLAGQTVYRDMNGAFYLAKGEINKEVEIFPYDLRCRFVKADNWERLRRPAFLSKGEFDPVSFFELKYVDEDEFSHWSSNDWPSRRKRREWENYSRVRKGIVPAADFDSLPSDFLDDQVRE